MGQKWPMGRFGDLGRDKAGDNNGGIAAIGKPKAKGPRLKPCRFLTGGPQQRKQAGPCAARHPSRDDGFGRGPTSPALPPRRSAPPMTPPRLFPVALSAPIVADWLNGRDLK